MQSTKETDVSLERFCLTNDTRDLMNQIVMTVRCGAYLNISINEYQSGR